MLVSTCCAGEVLERGLAVSWDGTKSLLVFSVFVFRRLPLEEALGTMQVHWEYTRLLLWPAELSCDYSPKCLSDCAVVGPCVLKPLLALPLRLLGLLLLLLLVLVGLVALVGLAIDDLVDDLAALRTLLTLRPISAPFSSGSRGAPGPRDTWSWPTAKWVR